jgi:hypothetical protein
MATLIDDATATDYFNGIDDAPEDQRQQMADDLLAWGKAKQAQEYNDTDDHFSKLFTDEAYFEQEKQANAAVQESLDPDQTAKSAAIGAWLEHRNGRPIDPLTYQVERDAYAMANYGKKNLDDAQLFDFISGEYNTQKAKTEAINDLQMQAVSKAITDSQLGQNRPFVDGMTEVFNQWQGKYPALLRHDQRPRHRASAGVQGTLHAHLVHPRQRHRRGHAEPRQRLRQRPTRRPAENLQICDPRRASRSDRPRRVGAVRRQHGAGIHPWL